MLLVSLDRGRTIPMPPFLRFSRGQDLLVDIGAHTTVPIHVRCDLEFVEPCSHCRLPHNSFEASKVQPWPQGTSTTLLASLENSPDQFNHELPVGVDADQDAVILGSGLCSLSKLLRSQEQCDTIVLCFGVADWHDNVILAK